MQPKSSMWKCDSRFIAFRAGRETAKRITYDIFRTFDLSFVFGGWYKQEERGL